MKTIYRGRPIHGTDVPEQVINAWAHRHTSWAVALTNPEKSYETSTTGLVHSMLPDTKDGKRCVLVSYTDETLGPRKLRLYPTKVGDQTHWRSTSGWRQLVLLDKEATYGTPEKAAVPAAPMSTPVEPPAPKKPLKEKEFSERGVMPSDHPGINEMLKNGFKGIFGGEMLTGPKKPPSYKGLLIQASEKYLGLGFNDGLE